MPGGVVSVDKGLTNNQGTSTDENDEIRRDPVISLDNRKVPSIKTK